MKSCSAAEAMSSLLIKPGLAASAIADLGPGRRGHLTGVILGRTPLRLADPLVIGRRPLRRRNGVPQCVDQPNSIGGGQRRAAPSTSSNLVMSGHRSRDCPGVVVPSDLAGSLDGVALPASPDAHSYDSPVTSRCLSSPSFASGRQPHPVVLPACHVAQTASGLRLQAFGGTASSERPLGPRRHLSYNRP